ncbi:MAG TPA: twin-arginine translocation signal domain-containing protein, partial [Candidatus Anammoximicrobium sp.]|nr:twin-arginine translocation signal domain-containing protein [Candidatus Anammoximicrobium sp.]
MASAGKSRNRHVTSREACLTRRRFLGTAAVAAPLLLPREQALGYAANEQLQVAVVGVGGRGSGFAVEEGWSSVRQQTGGR